MIPNMTAVTAAIIIKDEKILICRRPENKSLGGKWEFPGGKIERGETPRECLRRELKEELSIDAEIGDCFDVLTFYGDRDIILSFFYVNIVSGEITPTEHSDVRFVDRKELLSFDLCPSDTEIARRLANM